MRNMKKLVAALIVLTMALAMASTALAYTAQEYNHFVQFTGSAWGYEKVTNNYGRNRSDVALRKGSIGWADLKKGDWYRVWVISRAAEYDWRDESQKLWFNGEYLKDADGPARLIFSSGGSGRPTALADQDEEKITGGYKYVKIAKSGRRTNIRKSAGLNGKSYGVLRYGHKLKLHKDMVKKMDGRGVYWYKVVYQGKTRWVSAEYTKLVK